MANRTVKYAKLHTQLFIVGAGDLGTTLPSGSKSFKTFSMTYDGEGLHVEATMHAGGGKVSALVPPSSVAYVVFAEATVFAVPKPAA